jgi:hypothetical protein
LSSLFFQSSSSRNSRKTTFRSRVYQDCRPSTFFLALNSVPAFHICSPRSPLRPLLISFLFFDSLALPLPNENTVSTFHSLPPAHTHIIDQLSVGSKCSERVSAVALQPIVLWEIRYRSWIQRMK